MTNSIAILPIATATNGHFLDDPIHEVTAELSECVMHLGDHRGNPAHECVDPRGAGRGSRARPTRSRDGLRGQVAEGPDDLGDHRADPCDEGAGPLAELETIGPAIGRPPEDLKPESCRYAMTTGIIFWTVPTMPSTASLAPFPTARSGPRAPRRAATTSRTGLVMIPMAAPIAADDRPEERDPGRQKRHASDDREDGSRQLGVLGNPLRDAVDDRQHRCGELVQDGQECRAQGGQGRVDRGVELLDLLREIGLLAGRIGGGRRMRQRAP